MIKTDGRPTIAWAPLPPAPKLTERERIEKAMEGVDTSQDGWLTQYLRNLEGLRA